MASLVTQRQLIIQNENLDVSRKKVIPEGKKFSKANTKKVGNRKALNDITNKSSTHHKTTSSKKNLPKEDLSVAQKTFLPDHKDFNVAEEGFLHDHSKCIEAQEAALSAFNLDLVLPGYDSLSFALDSDTIQEKIDPESPHSDRETLEISMAEVSDFFGSTQWVSPPCSPMRWDSPPLSPLPWHFEELNFELKPEDEV